MFEKILVPLDGSTLAEQALGPAVELAEWAKGEIILVRVPSYSSAGIPIDPTYEYSWPQDQPMPQHAESADYLREVKNSLSSHDGPIKTMVVSGDRAGVIIDLANSEKVDLISMATHGRTGLSRWILGSVTSRVLSSAPCPVMVVHKAEPIKHILITLDGSMLAENAVKPGFALAHAFSAKVTLLRVMSDSDSQPIPENIDLQNSEETTVAEFEKANMYLKDLAAISSSENLEVETAVVTGPATSTILEFSAKNNVDLISMTTHGRSGLRRWIYGSTTEKVLHHTDCAMLIVRPS